MRRSLTLCALAAALTACPEPPVFASLEGQLVLRDDGRLDGITVHIDGPQPESTVTDDEGRYAFAALLPGEYEVSASLELWSREPSARKEVELTAGVSSVAPDLVLTPAGAVSGRVAIEGGGNPEGFRMQMLGIDASAVADSSGVFTIHRVPRGVYELVVERADIGSARRGGIEVIPFETTDLGTLTVVPGGNGFTNEHPRFLVSAVVFSSNATPTDAAVLPVPYLIPADVVRRFDRIALSAPATDDDGDALTYEWSASAGEIENALTEEPLWRPDEYAGSQATVTATIRDGHGGIASLSTDIEIVDVFSGTAHRGGSELVYAYRIEGGPWRIDIVDTTLHEARHLLEVIGEEPRPLVAGRDVVFRDGGSLWRHDLDTGVTTALNFSSAADTVIQPSARVLDSRLLYIDSAGQNDVRLLDVRSGNATTVATCTTVCSKLAVNGDRFAAFGAEPGGGGTFVFGDTGGTTSERQMPAPVGTGLAVFEESVAYVEGDSGRSGRNSAAILESGDPPRIVYGGFYDMLVWALDDEDVYITEQEYLALRHPPFIRMMRGNNVVGRFPPDDSDWMADRVYHAQGGVAVIRRLAGADWPEAFNDNRSEIVIVRSDEAFE